MHSFYSVCTLNDKYLNFGDSADYVCMLCVAIGGTLDQSKVNPSNIIGTYLVCDNEVNYSLVVRVSEKVEHYHMHNPLDGGSDHHTFWYFSNSAGANGTLQQANWWSVYDFD